MRKLWNLVRGKRMEHDLERELRYHLERRVADLKESRLSEPEAKRQAALEFGGVTQVQEEVRDAWVWCWLRDLLHDLRFSRRVLCAHPGFTATAVLSLALGIGANTAIFSFMDSILLRSLPVTDPQSLVRLAWRTRQDEVHGMNRHDDSYLDAKTGYTGGFFAYPAFELFRGNNAIFSSVIGYQGAGDLNLSVAGQAEVAKTEYVTGDYFRGLGIAVATGLFARTLSNLESIDLGFNRENVLTFGINATQAGHRAPEIATFYDDLRTQLAAIPGVRSASLSQMPLLGQGRVMTMVGVPGAEPKGSLIMNVGAGFFSTMEIPIFLGRGIEEDDRADAPMTAVVNRTFAKEWFGDRNPVGGHLTVSDCPTCEIEIVGVCGDARYGRLKQKVPATVFFSFAQWPVEDMTYEMRTAGNPLGYVQAAREIVHRADGRIPMADVLTQRALIDGMITREIAFAQLCTAFALLALGIACVGLYGTMSYNVARRTGEIGVRIALGAQRWDVARMVLRETMLLVAAGLALGILVFFAATRLAGSLISDLLYGLKPNDVTSVLVATAALAVAAAFAGLLPARRASRIDPLTAIRYE